MYENDIKAMLFQRSEVDAWMQQAVPAADGAQGGASPIPASILTQYQNFIENHNSTDSSVKKVTAYLYAAQGKSNAKIAEELGYSISSITKHINGGRGLAAENNLPSLWEYYSVHRKGGTT